MIFVNQIILSGTWKISSYPWSTCRGPSRSSALLPPFLYRGCCLLYSGTVWCYTMVSKLAILGEGPSYYPVLINWLVHLVTSLSFLTTMKVDIKCGNVWIKRIIMKCICLIQPLLSLPQCMCMPCQSVCLIWANKYCIQYPLLLQSYM